MCGIYCAVSCHQPVCPSSELQQLLRKRGPDSVGKVHIIVQRPSDGTDQGVSQSVHVTLFSTVLSLRGEVTVRQPYQDGTSQSTLSWNGEGWTVNGTPPIGNDTHAVFDILERAAHTQLPSLNRLNETCQRTALVAHAMSSVAGPYAFVFYDSANNLLFFGRDVLGRRSLLLESTVEGGLFISSVTDAPLTDGWSEIEADGFYCIDLLQDSDAAIDDDSMARFGRLVVTRVPYYSAEHTAANPSSPVIPRLSLNKQFPFAPSPLSSMAPSVLRLEEHLRRSLSLRILDIPEPPAIRGESAAQCSPHLAILFSGGLDCTVLARLAHDVLPLNEDIDLLNVAFENPRIHKLGSSGNGTESAYELCPDRITGRASYAELQRVCPSRIWRFLAINIPYTETLQHRQAVITLMHPHNTEMDLSISYALYFAARGAGYLSPSPDTLVPYTTSARVLLSGLGADELFGGYQRHATAFTRAGFTGLLSELDLDIGRLGKRNLGRDDRVISNWGREARFPYLDEELLVWALSAPVTDKCGFGEPAIDGASAPGDGSETLEPGKKVLRCLAWKLRMGEVAKEKKRAIQFGARTAKMETGKTKGTQVLS